MNLEKLKDSARKFEQKEDWRKAIEVYLKAIQQIESGAETSPDLSLYNRVGDLYLKINDTAAAVRSYERAVDLYADQGFFNNAIALCGKILRVNPGRVQTYLKLAQLHARKNVVIEAKRNLIEFLERMNGLGTLEQAFQSVKEFADQFSGSQEIRLMLVELLRAASREEEALEQLAKIAGDFQATGEAPPAGPVASGAAERSVPKAAPRPAPKAPGRGDLVFLDTGFDLPAAGSAGAAAAEPASAVEAAPPEGLEPTGVEFIEVGDGSEAGPVAGLESVLEPRLAADPVEAVEGLELDAPSEDAPFEGMPLDSMEQLEAAVDPEPVHGLLETADDLDLALSATDTGLADLDERAADLDLDVVDIEVEEIEPVDLADPPSLESVEPDQADAEVLAVAGLPMIDSPGGMREDHADPGLNALPPGDVGDAEAVEGEAVEGEAIEGEVVQGEAVEGEPVEAEADTAEALAELESRIADDPDNAGLHRELAEQLLTVGELPRAAEELRLSLEGYEGAGDWAGAAGVADRLVALEPDAIHHHQKRVELAFRTGERAPLLDAYLALGDALARAGATDKALAVYRRVQEHDPNNERATAAIAALSQFTSPRHATMASPAPPATRPAPPPPAARTTAGETGSPARESSAEPSAPLPEPPASAAPTGPPGGSFVDLGSMILDESGPRDTRMRIERREPQDTDEQREFAEILEQFKRGIDANLDTDDFQAHYDLGVAFKEMGLLDEAIAEFQKALRAPDGRLRTSEALGTAFFEKGQFAVSEAVLRRAVESVDGGDEAKIGLIYWLGRSLEAQGKGPDAITSYERAMAVDIRFMDLSERIQRLTPGRTK
jgi:tetratricopeptide (TPR) repeat protein